MKLISQPSKEKEKGSHSISTVVSVIVLNRSPRGVESSGIQRWGIQSFFSSGLTILLTTYSNVFFLSKVHNWETSCSNKTIRTLILGTHNSMLVFFGMKPKCPQPQGGTGGYKKTKKSLYFLKELSTTWRNPSYWKWNSFVNSREIFPRSNTSAWIKDICRTLIMSTMISQRSSMGQWYTNAKVSCIINIRRKTLNDLHMFLFELCFVSFSSSRFSWIHKEPGFASDKSIWQSATALPDWKISIFIIVSSKLQLPVIHTSKFSVVSLWYYSWKVLIYL